MKPPWIGSSRGVTMLGHFLVVLGGLHLQVLCLASKEPTEEFACFNTIFEISCHSNEVIVFDTARYGRNDTLVASRCQVPYQRNCDVDVHFPLNRVCAGKQKCSLAVNTALFGDPCGYEEFLRVKYRCVAVATIQQMCFGANGPTFYDHAFLASPNYPAKYYMDADCHWKLSVQKRQRITVTILDFELDVKKGGQCNDYLEISAGERVYFNDCGSLGKQVIQVDSSKSLVRFHAGIGSLAQRGFLIYFEALGPGCPDLEDLDHAWADYYIEQDVLYANVSCLEGFHFSGSDVKHQLLQCSGSHWDTVLTACIASTPPTTPIIILTSPVNRNNTSAIDDSGSLIESNKRRRRILCIALGVVSAILLITLLLVLALYFHKRRRNAERKLDQWRFVINNLQENSVNEENQKRATLEGSGINVMATPVSNVRKAGKRGNKKNKKINNKEDELQGRNLLTSPNYDDDDVHEIMMLDPRDVETMLKYPMPTPEEEAMRQKSLSRKNSRIGRYSLARSRESELENSIWVDCDGRDKPRSKRDLRYKRAKSGQWDAPMNKTFGVPAAVPVYPAPGELKRKQFTQSAPDLIMLPETCAPPAGNGDIFCCHNDIPVYTNTDNQKMHHPSTMTAVPVNRLNKPAVPPRTSSKNRIRIEYVS